MLLNREKVLKSNKTPKMTEKTAKKSQKLGSNWFQIARKKG